MTRNKALRAIQARVAQREHDALTALLAWDGKLQNDPALDHLWLKRAELLDARALLADATGEAPE